MDQNPARCELNLSYISRYTIENLMFFETEIQKIVSDIVRLHKCNVINCYLVMGINCKFS